MIAYAGDDVRVVQLRVTAALSIAVLFLTQLPFQRLMQLEAWSKGLLMAGLAAMALAAIGYYTYLAAVHHSKTDLAECLQTLDTERAKRVAGYQSEGWLERDFWFKLGDFLFAAGGALLSVVVAALLW